MRWPHGVLVAVPSRHRLVFAPVDDAVVDTLPAIAAVASYDYVHDHAPISPVVSWWKDGRLYPLFDPTASRLERPDRACFDIPDEFWEAWTRHLPGSEDVA